MRSLVHDRDHGGDDDGRLSCCCLAFRFLFFWGGCSTMKARPGVWRCGRASQRGMALCVADFFRREKAWACSPGSGVVVKGRVPGKAWLPAAG